MKKILKILSIMVLVCLFALGGCSSGGTDVTITLKDNGALITNKGMGWNFCYYSNQIYDFGATLKPNDFLDDFPCDIVYFRLGWNYIEPEDNVYNWEFTDRIAEEWAKRGKRAGFAWVVCYPGDQSTPLWLKDMGCKGSEFNVIEEGKKYGFDFTLQSFPQDAIEWMTNTGPRAQGIEMSNGEKKWIYNDGKPIQAGDVANYRKTWVPDYDDEIFMDKFSEFLRAAAERYDGQDWVEFIEVASFGSWGEGHTHMSWPAEITRETRINHIKMYNEIFTKTPIVVPRSCVKDTSAETLAKEYGFGVGDWSIQVPGISSRPEGEMVDKEITDRFYQTNPVALEHHPYTVPLQTYYDSVNEGHASWARLHNSPYTAKGSEWTDKITLRLGYRFVFEEVALKGLKAGKETQITFKLKNAGAAPNYIGGYPAVLIKDQDGKVVAKGVSDFDVKSLQVADTAEEAPLATGSLKLQLPEKMNGEYSVCIAIVDKEGNPFYNLPLKNGEDKVYKIATIAVK